MKWSKAMPLALTVGLATACTDTVLMPEAEYAPSMSSVTVDGAALRHVMVFGGSAPKNFEAQVEAAGGKVVLNHRIGIALVSGLTDESAAKLGRTVKAQTVAPEAVFELIEPAATSEAELAGLDASLAGEPGVTSTLNPAGAILFSRQWNMRQVKADVAWAAGHLGSPAVSVAILDTGIDYMLPDLAGLVDLSRSASFESRDDPYVAFYFPTRHPSTDLHYHGTNVATQVSSNAWAFAGVTSRTTLMSVKVCSVLGGCRGVLEGLLYAIDNGADVINMSLGGGFSKAAHQGAVSAYNRIMNYAHQQGVTVVVSAGNDANDLDTHKNIATVKDPKTGEILEREHVPSFFAMYCNATHVICVSSTRNNDVSASYTNYGRSAIDVAAPGGDAGDWVYGLCPQTSLLFGCGGGYYTLGVAGTSQAAPHVSGLAALAVAQVGRNPAAVKALIRSSADAIGGGNTPQYGKGRINVARLVGAE